jgi:trimethylamine--corrinoid protein Co-methyltransferase
MERYDTAFYQPMLSDWRTWEQWNEDGARTATERATGIWQTALAEYEAPPLDDAIAEELESYIAHRKEAIGDGEP